LPLEFLILDFRKKRSKLLVPIDLGCKWIAPGFQACIRGKMSTLEPDAVKTLLGVTTAKLKDVTDAIEKNWLIQVACAAVGVVLVFDLGGLTVMACKYFNAELCSKKSAGTILLPVQVFYFARFGQYLTAFLETKRLTEHLLRLFVDEKSSGLKLKPLHDSLSFFEGYYSPLAFSSIAPLRFAYFTVFLVIVAGGQAAAFLLLLQGYGFTFGAWIAFAVAAVGLGILYAGFWRANRDHPHTSMLVLLCVVFIVCAFIAMKYATD
jgi:hypothetical protein